MNEPLPASPAGGLSEKNLALIAYLLHLLGPLTVYLLNVAAVVINYVKRDEASPTWATHHRWMIHTFWWGLLWFVLAGLTFIIGIGFVIWLVLAIWWIYRHVRGLLALADGKPLPG
ncbi:MAG TPA: hypothetical protein VNJ47_03935 [Nevskiales bacterium]|nr:hypothetical protein [Nevskiales bacterium]